MSDTIQKVDNISAKCFSKVKDFRMLNRLEELISVFEESRSILEQTKDSCSDVDGFLVTKFLEYLGSIKDTIQFIQNSANDEVKKMNEAKVSTREERSCLKGDMLKFMKNLESKLATFTQKEEQKPTPGKRKLSRAETAVYRGNGELTTLHELVHLLQHLNSVNDDFRELCYNISRQFTKILLDLQHDLAQVRQLIGCCESMNDVKVNDLNNIRAALRKIAVASEEGSKRSRQNPSPQDNAGSGLPSASPSSAPQSPKRARQGSSVSDDATPMAVSRSEQMLNDLITFRAAENKDKEEYHLSKDWNVRPYITYLQDICNPLKDSQWQYIQALPFQYQFALPSPCIDKKISRFLIIAPTGTGKTQMTSECVRLLSENTREKVHPSSVLVIVEKKVTADVIHEYLECEWEEHEEMNVFVQRVYSEDIANESSSFRRVEVSNELIEQITREFPVLTGHEIVQGSDIYQNISNSNELIIPKDGFLVKLTAYNPRVQYGPSTPFKYLTIPTTPQVYFSDNQISMQYLSPTTSQPILKPEKEGTMKKYFEYVTDNLKKVVTYFEAEANEAYFAKIEGKYIYVQDDNTTVPSARPVRHSTGAPCIVDGGRGCFLAPLKDVVPEGVVDI